MRKYRRLGERIGFYRKARKEMFQQTEFISSYRASLMVFLKTASSKALNKRVLVR